jgi:hypothetical protein
MVQEFSAQEQESKLAQTQPVSKSPKAKPKLHISHTESHAVITALDRI